MGAKNIILLCSLLVITVFFLVKSDILGKLKKLNEIPPDQITEEQILMCETDADCTKVPYTHCCGGPKIRSINRKYLDLYYTKPEWQKFNNQEVCAKIGYCGDGKGLNIAYCFKNNGTRVGRCELRRN